MHKNIDVCEIEISQESGDIERITAVHNLGHLPIGTVGVSSAEKGKPNRGLLNEWWGGRSIPASRDGIELALSNIGIFGPALLLSKCYGLSLSDQYWICPHGTDLQWGAINFFDNEFSTDMGEILFGHEPTNVEQVNMLSPDNTSDGWLRKKWIIADGKRILMKGGSGDYQQEPLNELIACTVMRRLGISHVNYTLTFDSGKPYSLCENFITAKTELISADRVRRTLKQGGNDSPYTHLLRCCDELGIPDVRAGIDKMLVADYIIANTDRHNNNFGFIRNADTLEWLGLAPIYDSGTSLWHNTRYVGRAPESKPFRSTHAEQIKLVSDYDGLNFGELADIGEECAQILERSPLIDHERRTAIARAVQERVNHAMRARNEFGRQRPPSERPSAIEKLNANKEIVKQQDIASPRCQKIADDPEL